MTDISNNTVWSELAAANNAAPPNGFPEGMNVSAFNDTGRELMAAIKRSHGRLNPRYTTSGASNAYVLTPDSALSAYATGEVYSAFSNFTNSGPCTLAISGLAATLIKKYTSAGKVDLASGDIQSGAPFQVAYDGTHFVIFSPTAPTSTFATAAEVTTGTATSVPISPAGLSNAIGGAWTDLASAATTSVFAQTVGNVRITGTTTITSFGSGNSGTRRQLRFAGALTLTHNATSMILPTAANITTVAGDTAEVVSLGGSNAVVVSYQRASGAPLAGGGLFTVAYDSGNQTITNAGALTLAHGLGVAPKIVQVFLQCVSAEHGYTAGQTFPYEIMNAANDRGVSIIMDSTNLTVRFGSSSPQILHATSGSLANITNASWRMIFRAYA